MEKILETSLTYVDTHTYIMRREGPILIYRDIYCKPNIFRDDFISRVTADKLFRGDLFSRSGLIFFRVVVIIAIRQELIFVEKIYSRRRGCRETRKNFSHWNKSWFTITPTPCKNDRPCSYLYYPD